MSEQSNAFRYTVSPDGIAELVFDLPGEKVNKFSPPVVKELEEKIDELGANPSIKLLKIVSGKPDVFIAGADLHSFEPTFENPALAEEIIRNGHRVFEKIENLPFPTVAVINGACLGGGLELALSCTYRLVTDHPKTLLGLPEVNLGIFPGWGGTQRLPKLIGLAESLNMILGGKIVPGLKAYKMHIADAIAAWEFLPEKTEEFIRFVQTKEGKGKIKKAREQRSWLNWLLESNPIGRSILFSQARKSVLEKTKGRYPAPLIALEVMEKTCTLPLKEGLKLEADTFIANIPDGFYLAPDLIWLFFTQEAAKKESGVSGNIKPKPVHYAAVIGAGTMGAGIAWLLADHKIFTRLKDISWEIIGNGLSTAKSLFDKGLKNRKLSKSDYDRRLQLISGTIDYSGFWHSDLVIEAATENLELKKKIFAEVEEAVKQDAIIASNTSSLTIAEMSEGMKHPERFIGMHFFNPVHKMPLVEVVAGAKSDQQAIATAVDLCKKLGKVPIVVGDCPGFLVNRIFMQGANEVMFMLEEGYPMDELEKRILDFGMPMEPFELCDEVGNDVGYKVSKTFEEAYGDRMKSAKFLQVLNDHQLYGKKNKKGFYLYDGKSKKKNPEIPKLLKTVQRPLANRNNDDIVPRFLYNMINEAARCLEEKIIDRPDFLDLALIMGIGFPPYRGGLLRYADREGINKIVDTLHRYEKEFGPRFKPCDLLGQMARENRKFYGPQVDVRKLPEKYEEAPLPSVINTKETSLR